MQISNVFFNELMKRELGRQACQLHGIYKIYKLFFLFEYK